MAAEMSEPSSSPTTVGSPPQHNKTDGSDEHHHDDNYSRIPAGLTPWEYSALLPTIQSHHLYDVGPTQCSSLLSQRVAASSATVWSILRLFHRPQTYKHFIRSCTLHPPHHLHPESVPVGALRDVSVISGLPASTSTERLDLLDDDNKITGFTIIGGEHRLRNYRSVTSANEFRDEKSGKPYTVVLESYVVDVPEGNTEEDTRLFADTVVRLNLQKLAAVAEGMEEESKEKKKKTS